MKHAMVVLYLFLFLAPGAAWAGIASPDEEVTALPGGDVLRPGQKTARSSDDGAYPRWYLGLDAGLTYSLTMKTLPAFYSNTIDGSMEHLSLSNMENGSGLGFDVGLAIEVHFTPVFGLVGKVHYNTRSMTMSPQDHYTYAQVPATFPPIWQQIPGTTDFKTTLDFTCTNIDLLARFQIPSTPVYFLIGPSVGFLGDKKVKYTDITVQGQIQPDMSGSILTGVNSTRYELKAGIGGWFPLSKSVFFTPELTLAYPLNKLLKNGDLRDEFGNQMVIPEVKPFEDFNFATIFLTAGIRFGLN